DLDEFVDAVYGYNDQEDDEFDIYEYLTEEDMGKKKNKKKEKKLIGYDIFRKCRHYNHRIEFPDGTEIYASSHMDRSSDDEVPDLGVYLDSIWSPAGVAYFIDWKDFGLPRHFTAAVYTMIDA